jgi:hypothetical protein
MGSHNLNDLGHDAFAAPELHKVLSRSWAAHQRHGGYDFV